MSEIELLIVRYLDKTCTDGEKAVLYKWINSSIENKADFLKFKDIWDVSLISKSDSNTHLAKFYKSQYLLNKKSSERKIRIISSIAAVLLVGTIISVLLPYYDFVKNNMMHVYSVPLGSRSNVVLPDGTKVFLNSGSELSYTGDYNKKERFVNLKGEAFFDVETNEKMAFKVNTSDFVVVATGTSFNVCTYSENNFASATLAEGKIEINMNSTKQTFIINPGNKFELNRNTKTYKLGLADIDTEIAWKDGQFIFKSIPFPILVKRLERWYDVKLNYSESEFEDFAYTGSFKNQESIWQVLDALKLTSPIDYEKSNFREFKLIYENSKE